MWLWQSVVPGSQLPPLFVDMRSNVGSLWVPVVLNVILSPNTNLCVNVGQWKHRGWWDLLHSASQVRSHLSTSWCDDGEPCLSSGSVPLPTIWSGDILYFILLYIRIMVMDCFSFCLWGNLNSSSIFRCSMLSLVPLDVCIFFTLLFGTKRLNSGPQVGLAGALSLSDISSLFFSLCWFSLMTPYELSWNLLPLVWAWLLPVCCT